MKKSVFYLKKIYAPYIKSMIGMMFLLVISTLSNLFTPLINQKVMDDGLINRNFKYLLFLITIILALRGIDVLLTYIIEQKRILISKKVTTNLEVMAFDKVLNMKISSFNQQNAASIISKLDVDINAVSSLLESGFFSLLTQFMCLIGGIIGLAYIEWRLLIVVIAFGGIKYWIINFLGDRNKSIVKEYIRTNNNFAHWYSGIINGVREIKIYDIKKKIQKNFLEKVDEKNTIKQHMNLNSSYKIITEASMNYLLDFTLYAIGGYLIYKNVLSIGSVFAFFSYSAYITNPISVVLNFRYILSQLEPSVIRYGEFMEEEGEEETGKIAPIIPQNIYLKDLKFSYTEHNEVIKEANAVLHTNQINGFIGENGSGKTTILDLLLRFYLPTSGKIEWDSQDIKEINLQEYRNMFSVVSQKIYLFNDTVRNNILLNKNISDETIIEYMKNCGLEEFLTDRGLDYEIGENGSKLSGGEKQKIGLVRAIIQNRPIVLLDEATSNVDIFLEENLEKLVKKYFRDKTVIMITHKMEAFKFCDNIYFISDGKISHYSSYEEFLIQHEKYKKVKKDKLTIEN